MKGKEIKMETKKFIYFEEEDMLIGWLEEFPAIELKVRLSRS